MRLKEKCVHVREKEREKKRIFSRVPTSAGTHRKCISKRVRVYIYICTVIMGIMLVLMCTFTGIGGNHCKEAWHKKANTNVRLLMANHTFQKYDRLIQPQHDLSHCNLILHLFFICITTDIGFSPWTNSINSGF